MINSMWTTEARYEVNLPAMAGAARRKKAGSPGKKGSRLVIQILLRQDKASTASEPRDRLGYKTKKLEKTVQNPLVLGKEPAPHRKHKWNAPPPHNFGL